MQPQRRRHGPRPAVPRDQPGLPDRRPAADRRRHGPAHDARRADDLVRDARRRACACWSSPTRSTRSRPSTARMSAGGPLDSVYLLSYVLFGASALHPSMRRLTDPHPGHGDLAGPVRLVCLATAMLTGPAAPGPRSRCGRRARRGRRRHGAPVAAGARTPGRPGRPARARRVANAGRSRPSSASRRSTTR